MKPTDLIDIEIGYRGQNAMDDGWTSHNEWDDIQEGRYSDYSMIDELVKVVSQSKDIQIRELQHRILELESKARKKEKEFKEFRKLKKAIKADSINTRLARLVKRI